MTANTSLLTLHHQPVTTEPDPAVQCTRSSLELLFGPPATRPFAIRLWDGSLEGPVGARFTLVLRHPGALRRMLLPPGEVRFAEAYLRDEFDVAGDFEAATGLGEQLARQLATPGVLARLVPHLLRLPAAARPGNRSNRDPGLLDRLLRGWHSPRRDAEAVRFHYDLGNPFYRLWLDRRMVYSCAYFETGTEDLDTAQEAKLDYLCRKLGLRPGERLLDIGCGWGGLVEYASRHYGVEALGITLSPAQAGLAQERIDSNRRGSRCRVEVADYRSLGPAQRFDKIVSVGMVEHVGRANQPAYFAQAFRLLHPGGLFLNHGIVDLSPHPPNAMTALLWRPGSFIKRWVFPGGELVPSGLLIRAAETAGFETRDVESLREHYALTLRHWVRRLDSRRAEAVGMVGERRYRIWRLYMAGSARAFATGQIGVVQILLAKPDAQGGCPLPLTRAALYQSRV